MKTTRSLVRATVFFLAVCVSGVAWAQTSNGALVGTVSDPTGAVLLKAAVSAVSSQYGQTHETQTDSIGAYRMESLQPGVYSVTIRAAGFETLTVTGVVVNGSLTTTINGQLKLATAQQTIEVEATAEQTIDTQSGQLGESLSRQDVAALPYLSLNPAKLIMTLPGVHDTPQGQGAVNTYFTEGIAFSVNGSRPRANNFLIDGQDDNDYGITGQAYQPTNYGAIQEVTFLTNAYPAEYGHGGGSVTNYIYKSGTNAFHGDLWEINRNSALAAIPAEATVANAVTKNPYDNENTFGFDVGGPLKKDKLFVFGAVQWDRERQAVTGPVFDLPTAAGIATLKSLQPNANISLFLQAIGPLVSPGLSGVSNVPLGLDANGNQRPSVEIGLFQVQNVRTVSNGYDFNVRMDWHFTNNDTLTGSFIRGDSNLAPDNFANPKALPGFQTQQGGPAQIARVQWVHTLSPKMVNEFRFSYSSIDFAFSLLPATAANPLANIPFIEFGSDINFPSIGIDSTYPQGRSHKTYQVQEALSHASGRHAIKGGIDFNHVVVADGLALNQRGTIEYNSGGTDSMGATYTSLGNFIDDMTGENPGFISRSLGNPNFNTSTNIVAPYIQDTWRATDNLTLNVGLRYEYWSPLANVLPFPAMNTTAGFGVPGFTDPTNPGLFNVPQVVDKRNFAPRIGIAYSPHWGRFLFGENKTVFRAGYGIFYDGLFSNIAENTAESAPNVTGGDSPSPTGRGIPMASTFPDLQFSTIFSMASNLHNPLTQQWNVDMQRSLPLGLVLTLAYVGTRGEHLFANQDFNPQVLYSFTNPNFGEIAVRTNAGDSRYNSGQIEVERNIHRSLMIRGAYTYSKFSDDTSEINTTTGLSSFSQVLTDQKSDWGPSAFDQRHRFSIAYDWRVPYIHGNTFLRALTDQWEWSGIASIESGTPNTVSAGFDNIGNGHPNSRPDLGNPAAPLNSLGIDGGDIGFPPGTYDFHCLFFTSNTCPAEPSSTFHFIIPNMEPGNVGRNSLFGPGQVYFDTSIERHFPLHIWKLDNQQISFRVDLFNAFNHPNLFTPSYNMFDINFNNTAITINGGRQIKLWLKFSF